MSFRFRSTDGNGLRSRIITMVVISSLSMFLSIGASLLVLHHETVNEKRVILEALTQTALSAIAKEHDAFKNGALSEDEAKARALAEIRALRWGDAEAYWWVNDLAGVMLAQPADPKIEGKNRLDVKDADGKLYYQEFVQVAKQDGAGFVEYRRNKPGDPTPLPKLSHVRQFQPWGWVVGTGVYMDDVQGVFLWNALLQVAGALVISGLAVGWAARRTTLIVRPLEHVSEAIERLAGGDMAVEISAGDQSTADEIKRLAKAVSTFRQVMIDSHAMTQERERAQVQERVVAEAMARTVAGINMVVLAASEGDFSKRVPTESVGGDALKVAESVNTMMNGRERLINEFLNVLNALADGDVSRPVAVAGPGIFAKMRDASSSATKRMSEIVGQIRSAADGVRQSAEEGVSEGHEMAQRAEGQAAALEETASAIEEIASTVRHTADNAIRAEDLAQKAADTAHHGGTLAVRMTEAMGRIQKNSRSIADIVGLIDEIAFQTNLLALNAAVEAARVGDAGKGFAVVAAEVRALAQRSGQASKEIRELVRQAGSEVTNGAEVVQEVAAIMEGLVGAMREARGAAGDIANAAKEQALGIEEIRTAMVSLDKTTQSNLSMAEARARQSQSLAEQAAEMADVISFLKVAK